MRGADWTEPASQTFGRVKADLERRGQRIDDMDVAIASVALVTGAAVATCNVRYFERIPELEVQDGSE